jgi:CRISPR-associated protein (TIGR03986 family)
MPENTETLPEGVIIQVSLAGGYFVVRGDDKSKVECEVDPWIKSGAPQPTVGMRVRYDIPKAAKRALKVYLIAAPQPAPDEILHVDAAPVVEPIRPNRYDDRAKAFLNPYNFVRPLVSPVALPAGDADLALLGRCPPPPHDRYVGVTGTIRCTIKTRGSVFVADSHHVTEADGHRTYQFFRTFKDGAELPAIPGSSLRGVVRSVFEAVTNSCWEHVHDSRLSRRIETRDAASLVPGRLHRMPDGTWQVQLFTGTIGQVRAGGPGRANPQYAAWVLRYKQNVRGRERVEVQEGIDYGTLCRARIRKISREENGNKVAIWNVERLGARDDVEHPTVNNDDVQVVEGYFVYTGCSIKNKHDERFFFPARSQIRHAITPDVVRRYRMLLQSYHDLEDARKRTEETKAAPPSWFAVEPVPPTDADCDGHFVYVRFDPDVNGEIVQDVAPVSVPRLFYSDTVRDRFPKDEAVEACSHFNARTKQAVPLLCPACRTFGWVMASERAEGEGRSTRRDTTAGERDRGAYRSRVRFGDAVFAEAKLVKTSHTLPALSAPKPTTVRFYLMPKSVNLRDRVAREAEVDYNQQAMVVRGRKFYRGHGKRLDDSKPTSEAAPTNRNRTLRDHLPAGQNATFDVHFQNLAEAELGALLWALELEDDTWVHRLGLGKPLGMGAVSIKVTELQATTADRYVASGSEWAKYSGGDLEPVVKRLRRKFRDALCLRYGAADFLSLPNVRDLAEMLSTTEPHLDVEYPTLTIDGETGGHLWFGVNRRAKTYLGDDGEAHWLDLADGDGGLPRNPTRVPPGQQSVSQQGHGGGPRPNRAQPRR